MAIENGGGGSERNMWQRLRLTWLRNEPDAGIALIIAIIAILVDTIPGIPDRFKDPVTSNGTLLVLALVATTLIRNRMLAQPAELRQLAADSRDALATMAERHDEVTGLLEQTRHTLDQVSVVSLLAGSQVRAELAAAWRDSNSWIFKGGTGTFIRAVTLRECVENSRAARRPLRVQLEIIDPENTTVCEAYARFRRSLPTGKGDPWTAERARLESYATILAASWYRKHNDFLTIAVGLSSTISTCRWDMAASHVIVTREDPAAPALLAAHDKLYYSWCQTELNISFSQARHVPIDRVLRVPLADEPALDEVRDLFQTLGLPLDSFRDAEVIELTRRALAASDPYL
ncbi:hypothetical protein GCM10009555_028440 [Acrocarpospora macrocephala]|uniref:Uncharacterized protein n=1 Tax=Acrocarpospora macrocephala TaxID=150177 RepID=A0A5M3X283_9ACTN|nr:hypothetical protein [Acrocarpospora macrocephala]GES15857.1 hypothetical protein Amac_094550 [Acrocarpospora macrocephala]